VQSTQFNTLGYLPILKTVALPVLEIIGGNKKIPTVPVYVTLSIPKLESLICILPLTVWVYLRWNVHGGLREFYFCKSDVLAI